MTTVILILTIFNTGLIFLAFAGIGMIKEQITRCVVEQANHIDDSIETATTAIFNMDSIKHKVDTTGRFEI